MLHRFFARWIAVSLMWTAPVHVAAEQTSHPETNESLPTNARRETPMPENRQQPVCPPLLGLDPPGETPEVFAPDLFAEASHRLHGAVAVSPDGAHICWPVLPPAVVCVHCEGGVWTGPQEIALPGRGVQAPAFSPDGKRLYFQASTAGGLGSLDIWWVDVETGVWPTANNIGSPVNSPGAEGQPTLTEEGEIFFLGSMEGVEYGRGIFHAPLVDGAYQPPQALPKAINTPGIDFYPFVAVDGRSLLIASNRGHSGERLFIHATFRRPDGGWSEPVNIHPLMGFPDTARFPSLSPDGSILFFLSGGQFWWVDASVLSMDALR